MAKPKYFGEKPKKDFKPPTYTGKKSENTWKPKGIGMRAYYNNLGKTNQHELDWKEEMEYWRNKIRKINKDVDLEKNGKSINELEQIFNNLSNGKEWDYVKKKESSNSDGILTL